MTNPSTAALQTQLANALAADAADRATIAADQKVIAALQAQLAALQPGKASTRHPAGSRRSATI